MSDYRRSLEAGGCYFFTATLANRRSSLLVERIEQLRSAYRLTQQTLPFRTLAVCVLPEHLHVIWELPADDNAYPQRWSLLKSTFSRSLPIAAQLSASKARRREKGIWQRRYWEHRIRDAEDLQRHFDYIHYNPIKHGLVTRVRDWPYSSFHHYARHALLPWDWADEPAGIDATRFGE